MENRQTRKFARVFLGNWVCYYSMSMIIHELELPDMTFNVNNYFLMQDAALLKFSLNSMHLFYFSTRESMQLF